MEGEISHFSSSPLYHSSDHEDVFVHLEIFDCGCPDIFIHSSDDDFDSLVVDLSKPLVFDDPSSDEVENPQFVEALHLKLMVMSGSRSP